MRTSPFEITIPAACGNQTGLLQVAAPRGLALGYLAGVGNSNIYNLASGTNFVGFVTRDVTVLGATLEDRIFGRSSIAPLYASIGPEFPDKAGTMVTTEQAEEVEAEGALNVLTSGTGLLSAATTVGTNLSFREGKFSVAQASDTPLYVITAVWTAADDLYDTANLFRIRAQKI